MSLFEKTILKNGLRVITVPKSDSLATTVLVLVEAGSKYETKEINGLSHFLEHMCFKGTVKRPRSIDITNELNNIGSVYNAFTSQEYTGYFAKARNNDLDTILDIVSDIYLNPVFEAKEIEKEKGVIIEEINMYEDVPQRKVGLVFNSLLYGDQPAGWNIAGRKEVIQKLNRDDFVKYRGEHYVGKATTLVIAGGFNEAGLLKKIEEKFSNISQSAKSGKIKTIEVQDTPALALHYKESDQSHLVLGVRAYNLFDERRYALDVMSEILGAGMGSRLFERLRNEMGVAYYVGAGTDLSTDHGSMIAYAGVDNKRLLEVVGVILEEFRKLKDVTVPAEELARIKNRIAGNTVLGLETSDDLANFYGGQEILERVIMTPEEVISKVNAVTSEEIKAVANDVFKNEKLNFAVVGPTQDEEKAKTILKI